MISEPTSSGVAASSKSSAPSLTIGLGPALRRAWLGYQLRLDTAMAKAGFAERRFPDGRVLRLCAGEVGSTISAIGRELGITRQGAAKVVAHLRERGYVTVADSPSSGREKSVTLTVHGMAYLDAQRTAARSIERELFANLGGAGFSALEMLLGALGDRHDDALMRDYLRQMTDRGT